MIRDLCGMIGLQEKFPVEYFGHISRISRVQDNAWRIGFLEVNSSIQINIYRGKIRYRLYNLILRGGCKTCQADCEYNYFFHSVCFVVERTGKRKSYSAGKNY